jgi:hypothetical protein
MLGFPLVSTSTECILGVRPLHFIQSFNLIYSFLNVDIFPSEGATRRNKVIQKPLLFFLWSILLRSEEAWSRPSATLEMEISPLR